MHLKVVHENTFRICTARQFTAMNVAEIFLLLYHQELLSKLNRMHISNFLIILKYLGLFRRSLNRSFVRSLENKHLPLRILFLMLICFI